MNTNIVSKLKRFAIGAAVLGMAVIQPIDVMPTASPLNTVVTAEAAVAKKKPGKVTLRKISSPAYNQIKITWKKASNTTNYVIYYKKQGARKWTKLKTVSSKTTSYTHKSSKKYPIVVGQKYTYTVRAYNNKAKKYGSYNTKGLTARTLPGTVKLKKASLNSKKTVATITWNKASGANHYVIFRKTGSSGWKKLGTVSSKYLKYNDRNPVTGTKNTYTVRAYYSKTKTYGKYNTKGVSVTLPKVKVKKLALNRTSVSLTKKGQTYQLKATASPSNATNKSVTWKSSNTKVVTVNSSGKLTAVGNGSATITATAKDGSKKKVTCKVTVKIPTVIKVSSVSLNKSDLALTSKGQSYQLSATVSPSNASNKSVKWTSSNPKVATVSSSGKVTAVANGNTTITATAADGSGKKDICAVTVNIPKPADPTPTPTPDPNPGDKPAGSIRLSPSSITFTTKGESTMLSVLDDISGDLKNSDFVWTSSNNNVVEVYLSDEGWVTAEAVNNGTATITATANDGSGRKATCDVTVKIPAPSNVENVTLAGGESYNGALGPGDVAEGTVLKDIEYVFSGNTDCIELNGEGYDPELYLKPRQFNVTALKAGTIKVTAQYNGKTIHTWNITTSNWPQYIRYESWKRNIESQIWTNEMSVKEKLSALHHYINTNWTYGPGCKYVYALDQTTLDCVGASSLFGNMAKDLGVRVGYVDYETGTIYDYENECNSYRHGHMYNAVWLDGQWIGYDAQPPHEPH